MNFDRRGKNKRKPAFHPWEGATLAAAGGGERQSGFARPVALLPHDNRN